MPSYVVRNENFRDEVLKYSYPFDERSSLENEELYIGTDLFVDACIYLKEPAELPLYISQVDGTYGTPEEAQFILSDNSGRIVARAPVSFSSDRGVVLNNDGVRVGIFVYHLPSVQRFINRVTGRMLSLLPSVAAFSPDVTHVTKTNHLRYVATEEGFISGDVRVVAGHGMYFSMSEEGRLSLNITGDPLSTVFSQNPITSINGVRNQSIWLTAHPRLNLRISSEGKQLSFLSARDET